MQTVKPILKHVTSKFSVQKKQFYAQFETCVEKVFIEAFKYQKYTKFD